MNRERILALAEHLEQVLHHEVSSGGFTTMSDMFNRLRHCKPMKFFNMGSYCAAIGDEDPECMTAGCIAGHAVALWPPYRFVEHSGWYSDARRILGLDSYEADALFYLPTGRDMSAVQPHEAAQACRRLVDDVPLDKLWDD